MKKFLLPLALGLLAGAIVAHYTGHRSAYGIGLLDDGIAVAIVAVRWIRRTA